MWSLSELIPLRLFGDSYIIPGYLVWTALIYAIAGSVMTHWIGRRLVAIDFEQEQREANFRFALVRGGHGLAIVVIHAFCRPQKRL